MATIDYDHDRNLHTAEGPRHAFQRIFSDGLPRSVLDVGCGTGTWLKAAIDSGVTDVFGVDGIVVPTGAFLVSRQLFLQQDLSRPWSLGRRFDVALCLEVAEHLDEACAGTLVDSLTAHAHRIVFSAACPGQPGQHHVNCQWPQWWQKRFNDRGFTCHDTIRWRIWDETEIEPWYRQNIFEARCDEARAGMEPRIPSVIHPDFVVDVAWREITHRHLRQVEDGSLPLWWYLTAPWKALGKALARKVGRAVRVSR